MATDLFSADFSQVGGTDLYAAILEFTKYDLAPDDRTQEGYTVDFKAKWDEKSLRVVAAFANTFGGIIIIGVSDVKGRAMEVVGEESNRELKTRIADSIAANISPTPNYDLAECEMPEAGARRLCVIRVRPSQRIQYLVTKDSPPVYVRNEDQAIPAKAAELRALIQRERDSESGSLAVVDHNRIFYLLPFSQKPRPAHELPPTGAELASTLRVWIAPEHRHRISLDYDIESIFEEIIQTTFPKDGFAEDHTWSSGKQTVRDKSFVRLEHSHLDRQLESKWVFTSDCEFGYVTQLSLDFPTGGPLWSLADLTMELLGSISSAHQMLFKVGYLAEAHIHVSASPVNGQLCIESDSLPLLRHATYSRDPRVDIKWRDLVPKPTKTQSERPLTALIPSTFHTRTAGVTATVADLLNQLLREMGQGAVMLRLREFVNAFQRVKT